MRHIDITYLYIRDEFKREIFSIAHVPGAENPSDMFTKPLGPVKLSKFAEVVLNLSGGGRVRFHPQVESQIGLFLVPLSIIFCFVLPLLHALFESESECYVSYCTECYVSYCTVRVQLHELFAYELAYDTVK